jgi:hypothetical protein
MPEGGAERLTALFLRHHNCPGAKRRRAETGDPDIDLLMYPVGLIGESMPAGVVFEVEPVPGCGVCGKAPKAWAEWVAPQVFVL